MKELLAIALGPAPALVGLGLLLWGAFRMNGSARVPRFTRLTAKRLLTGNEAEFLGRLRRALPDMDVMPQVAMGALLDVNLSPEHPAYWPIRRQFAMKVIDFVICRGRGLEVVAVVELDDRSHDGKRHADAHRDAMLRSAGIATIRWDSRDKPSVAAIARQFQALQASSNKPATV